MAKVMVIRDNLDHGGGIGWVAWGPDGRRRRTVHFEAATRFTDQRVFVKLESLYGMVSNPRRFSIVEVDE